MAKCTPSSSRPGTVEGPWADRRPAGKTNGVEVLESVARSVTSTPTSTPVSKEMPSSAIMSSLPTEHFLVQLEVRNAESQQAADVVGPLVDTVTQCPARLSCCAAGQTRGARADHRNPSCQCERTGGSGPNPSASRNPAPLFPFPHIRWLQGRS